ncbi:MAG TPA: flagellar protein [Lachnospiraceae bacterium]|nr:flagellar protein [Lachnospiraceae bacterium]
MQRIQKNYSSIDSMRGQLLNHHPKTDNSPESELSFQDIFRSTKEQAVDGLKFSKHANERLATRNINLSAEQMERLENGTTKAREKGIRESLVMVDDLAFIVNVKNNTVITAVGDTTDSIFTNIDGAVIS